MKVRNVSTLCPYMFKAFYDWLVDSDVTPHLLIKVQTKGVVVPAQFASQEVMVLSISPSAVRNFDIGPKYLTFNTRFSGVDEHIVIPYKAMCDLIAHEDQVAFPINMWMQQDLDDDDQESPESSESVFALEDAQDDALFRTVDEVNSDDVKKEADARDQKSDESDSASLFTIVDKD